MIHICIKVQIAVFDYRKKKKLSIEYCKSILNKDGYNYTDEQVEQIRDFLYLLADIQYQHFNMTEHEEESDSVHPGFD